MGCGSLFTIGSGALSTWHVIVRGILSFEPKNSIPYTAPKVLFGFYVSGDLGLRM